MTKIAVSIIQYGDISNKAIHIVAMELVKNNFQVNYFWCKPGVEPFSKFKHPSPSSFEVRNTLSELDFAGVRLIEFNVDKRLVYVPTMPWIGTNFFEKFYAHKTDVMFAWRSGRKEFPYYLINKPLVEWNVFGFADQSPNMQLSLAISPLCQDLYHRNGGVLKKSLVAYVPVNEPATNENLRIELEISPTTLVCGMHQRDEDGIYSSIPLNSFFNAIQSMGVEAYFLMLGGSKKYSIQAKELGLKNFIQLPHNSDASYVSKFLNTLNLYVHGRHDGETLGRVIQEAMIHGVPVLSHTAQWNAHIETLGGGGMVLNNEREYSREIIRLLSDLKIAKDYGSIGKKIAIEKYSRNSAIQKIISSINLTLKDEYLFTDGKQSSKISPMFNLYCLIRFFGIKFMVKAFNLLLPKNGYKVILFLQNLFNKTKAFTLKN
jgi:hypothetical protein